MKNWTLDQLAKQKPYIAAAVRKLERKGRNCSQREREQLKHARAALRLCKKYIAEKTVQLSFFHDEAHL